MAGVLLADLATSRLVGDLACDPRSDIQTGTIMTKIVLRGINGPIQGTIWESSELLRVGRLDALEVVLSDSSVSRYHAEVRHGEGGWRLRDLGSTNGTFLNGERLGGERVRIDHGDEVRFGNVAVKVRMSIVDSEAWDACTRPLSMLESLPHVPWTATPYHRKLRLWAVDCIRRHGGHNLYSSQDFIRRALKRVEALTDLDPDGFERGRLGLLGELVPWSLGISRRDNMLVGSLESVLCPLHESLPSSLCHAAMANPWYCDEGRNALNAGVLRCVLGNPWRPAVIDPSWLIVNEGAVTALAQTIERDCAFEDMPILADALEDAGCSDERLLGHLRGGVHCRGCHALDAVLGRPALFG